MGLFGTPSGPSATENAPAGENGSDLPTHKDPSKINPGPPKAGSHGGARPGSGRKAPEVRQERVVAAVPSKPKLEVKPEDVRPFAVLPFETLSAVMDSDTFLLEKDQEDRHAVHLAAAVNDVGIQIAHAPVYAYIALVGSTVGVMFAKHRKEKKAKAEADALKAPEIKDGQPRPEN